MISSKWLTFISVFVVIAMLLPSLVSATSPTSTITTQLQFDSQHADQVNSTTNVANDSAPSNPSTWNPTFNGIWVGSSTEESLFQFNQVTSSESRFAISSDFKFGSHTIMSGASEFTVRLPFYIEPGMTNMELYIIKLSSDPEVTYSEPSGSQGSYLFMYDRFFSYDSGSKMVAGLHLNASDVLVNDGNDQWVRNNRLYVTVHAPIEPNVVYRFIAYVEYPAESNFKVYLSPDDIANDLVRDSYVNRYIRTAPDKTVYGSQNYSIDLGWSFDFVQGIGGGVMAKDFYLNANDEVSFWCYASGMIGSNGYHTLMLPFQSSDGFWRCSLTVYDVRGRVNGNVTWQQSAWTYHDYICVSSNSTVNVTGQGQNPAMWNWVQVVVHSEEAKRLRFYFIDSDRDIMAPNLVLAAFDRTPNSAMCNVSKNLMFFTMMSSYSVNAAQVVMPNMIYNSIPLNAIPIINTPVITWAGVIGVLMVLGGIVLCAIPGMAPGGIVMIGVGITMYVSTNTQQGIDLNNALKGYLQSGIDAIWNALVAVGNFIKAIGEAVYDFLKWLVDVVMEYGSYLLGFLIIFVALIIFFWVIKEVTAIWIAFYMLAQGKAEAAGAKFQAVVGDVERAGKHVARYSPQGRIMKAYSKIQKGRRRP